MSERKSGGLEDLKFMWGLRLRLKKEGLDLVGAGRLLWGKAGALTDQADRLVNENEEVTVELDLKRAEGERIRGEGNRLMAEGEKLMALGDEIWLRKILDLKGNVAIRWKMVKKRCDFECHLGTGEKFTPPKYE